MTERQILDCIEDIASAQYKKTGDKWWLDLADSVEEKKKKGINRWWLK